MIKTLTFGLPLDETLKAQARAKKGFIEFVDDEHFTVEVEGYTDEDFVYVKRNNGENLLLPFKK